MAAFSSNGRGIAVVQGDKIPSQRQKSGQLQQTQLPAQGRMTVTTVTMKTPDHSTL